MKKVSHEEKAFFTENLPDFIVPRFIKLALSQKVKANDRGRKVILAIL